MRTLTLLLSTMIVASIVACTALGGTTSSSADPVQQTIDLTYNSAIGIDAAIKSADLAVKAGKLKGQDGANVIAGLRAAKAGLDATILSIPPAAAASGVTK